MIRRFSLALALVLACTAGMRAYAPSAPTINQTTICFLTSVHGQITAGADSAMDRARLQQPDAIVLIDDVTGLQLGGYDTRAELMANYLSWIRERSRIPVYGSINNWDYGTAGTAATAPNYAFTAADSIDPLADARQAIPYMDWYGNWVQDIGLVRVISLNTCFTSLLDSCETSRRKFDPATGHGTGFGGTGNQDRAYQPASMYSNWNTYNSPGYNFVRNAIQSAPRHVVISAPNGFYSVQGDTSTSGVWCWNRAKVFMNLVDSCTTASGLHVAAVLSGHQHCYWHITARHDSAIAYTSGGVDHINGPPCGQPHAPAIAAQTYAGNISPDTCIVDSVSRWQDHGGVNGALLQSITTGGKFKLLFTKPAWMTLRASWTQLTWTVFDSSGVKDTWTRGVR